MMYLLDREQIRRAVFRGYGVIGNDQPIIRRTSTTSPACRNASFDPDKAKFHFQKAKLGSRRCRSGVAGRERIRGNGDAAPAAARRKPASTSQVNRVPADGYWSNHWMKHPLGFGNVTRAQAPT